jgi:plastocyanin
MTSADKFGIVFAVGFTAVMIGLISAGTFSTSEPSFSQSTQVETYSPPPKPIIEESTPAQSSMASHSENSLTTVLSYNIRGGIVEDIVGDSNSNSVDILIDSRLDGQLTITIISSVVQSFDDGSYFVLVDDEEVYDFTQNGSILTIPFLAGTTEISILGINDDYVEAQAAADKAAADKAAADKAAADKAAADKAAADKAASDKAAADKAAADKAAADKAASDKAASDKAASDKAASDKAAADKAAADKAAADKAAADKAAADKAAADKAAADKAAADKAAADKAAADKAAAYKAAADKAAADKAAADKAAADKAAADKAAALPMSVSVENATGSSSPGCEPNCFIPNKVTVAVGGTVTFVNSDTAPHTSTSGTPSDGPSGVWDSSLVMPGASYDAIISSAGTYDYFCMVHPWMTGIVIAK